MVASLIDVETIGLSSSFRTTTTGALAGRFCIPWAVVTGIGLDAKLKSLSDVAADTGTLSWRSEPEILGSNENII
jgi:hypothetical protein